MQARLARAGAADEAAAAGVSAATAVVHVVRDVDAAVVAALEPPAAHTGGGTTERRSEPIEARSVWTHIQVRLERDAPRGKHAVAAQLPRSARDARAIQEVRGAEHVHHALG